jgi:hypothetical protein
VVNQLAVNMFKIARAHGGELLQFFIHCLLSYQEISITPFRLDM